MRRAYAHTSKSFLSDSNESLRRTCIRRAVQRAAFLEPLESRLLLTAAPIVDAIRLNGGASQRSTLADVEVDFSDNVGASINTSDLVITNSANQTVSTPNVTVQYQGATNTAIWSFPNTTLPNGFYHARLVASGISDGANTLDGNRDGTPGDDLTFGFDILKGDANGDGVVDASDLALVQQNFLKASGQFDPAADLTGDGKVNAADLLIVRNNWQNTLAPPIPLDQAQTIQNVAAALYYQPTKILEFVQNTDRPEFYPGAMKGPTAVLETKAGNSWDQSSLLAGLLAEAGVYARYATAKVEASVGAVENWVGAKDGTAAANILANARLNPITITSGGNIVSIEWDHTWVQAYLKGMSGTYAWTDMDPTWKSRDFQPGVSGILAAVPFNESGQSNSYLAHTTTTLAAEFYENQVSLYLATALPGTSLADVPYDGAIIPRNDTSVSGSLVVTPTNTVVNYNQIPTSLTHRVHIWLTDNSGATTYLNVTLAVPQVDLSRLNVEYAAAGAALRPQFVIDGQVYTSSNTTVASGAGVVLHIDHLSADGTNTIVSDSPYSRTAGQILGIGLDANQISQGLLDSIQQVVNNAAITKLDGGTPSQDALIGAFLDRGVLGYLYDCKQSAQMIAGLTGAVEVPCAVGSGITTANPTVTYFAGQENPYVPGNLNVDVANLTHFEVSITSDTSHDAARSRIIDDNGSAEEHAIWEELAQTESISTIKSLQLAGDRSIPVVTITQANFNTTFPQLNFSDGGAAETDIQQRVQSLGETVTVPVSPTNLNQWQGVGYIATTANSSAYIIFGSISGSSATKQTPVPASKPAATKPTKPTFHVIFSRGRRIIVWTRTVSSPKKPISHFSAKDLLSAHDSRFSTGGATTGLQLLLSFVTFGWYPFSASVSDPILVANGDVTHDETDLHLPAAGIPLDFARHYDSQSQVSVGFGTGWMATYTDFLTFNPDSSITWTDHTGARYNFTSNGAGGYNTPDTLHGTLTFSGGVYRFRSKDGTTTSFDSSGRLQEIRDRNNNALQVNHNAGGQLTTVVDENDSTRFLSFGYTAGLITSVTDFTGRTFTYAYSGGMLASVTSPSDASTPAYTTQYVYYTDATLNGKLKQVIAPDGGVTSFAYYANGYGFEVTDATGYTTGVDYNLGHNRSIYIDARGNRTIYDYNNQGYLVHETYADGASESWVWTNSLVQSHTDTFGKTETWTYDANGNVLSMQDLAGRTSTFTYDPTFSKLTGSTLPGARTTTMILDAHGNPTSITDPMNGVTALTYDAHGDVLTRTDPRGTATPAPGDYTTTYTYNSAGQVLTQSSDLPSTQSFSYDARGDLISVTDADHHTTTYTYDALGRRLSATDPLGGTTTTAYTPIAGPASSTDALGRTTNLSYDLDERLTRTVDAANGVTILTYDGAGNLIAKRDPMGHVTRYFYDEQNRLIATLYADGAVDQIRYDGGNRVVATTNALGNTTTYTYDALGRLLTTTNPLNQTETNTYDTAGNLATTTDARTNTTTYTYDKLQRELTSTNAANQTTSWTYDGVGNVLTMTDPMNRTTHYTYDMLNRRLTESDDLSHTTTYTYDAVGNLLTTTDPLTHATTNTYDALNRDISTQDALNGITKFAYDAVGNRISLTDPDGNTTTDTYDALNRMTSETDAVGKARLYSYNANSELVSMTDRDGRVTRYSYDVRDRKTQEVWLDNSGNITNTINTTYDLLGEQLTVGDANSAYKYAYDAAGRVSSVDISGLGAASAPNTTTYNDTFGPGSLQYNGSYYKFYFVTVNAGDTLTVTMSSNALAPYLFLTPPSGPYLQNGGTQGGTPAQIIVTGAMAGQWVIEATTYPGMSGAFTLTVTTQAAGAQDVVLTYGRDAEGNVTSTTDSFGGVNTATYDALNRESSIQQTGTNVTAKRVDFTYNAAGQANTVTQYSDLAGTQQVAQSTYGYDTVGRLTSLTQMHNATTINSYTWSFDGANRITQMTSVDGTDNFTYDNTNQLTSASQIAESYTYDANGNRVNTGYATSDNNQLASDGTYLYKYDDEGNRISRTNIATGEVTTYQWDNRNRLTRVTDTSSIGAVLSDSLYTYDPFDRRIGKSVSTNGGAPVIEHDVYDGQNILFSLDGNGAISHRYLAGPGINEVFADQSTSGQTLWYLTDNLGTVRDIVNNTGLIQNHVSYDSFGNITAQTNSTVGVKFGYTGQQLDAETGMWYMHARYYDPKDGRFISSDPSGLAAGDVNTYRYVANQVTGLIDPLGMCRTNGNNSKSWQQSNQDAAIEMLGIAGYGNLVWAFKTSQLGTEIDQSTNSIDKATALDNFINFQTESAAKTVLSKAGFLGQVVIAQYELLQKYQPDAATFELTMLNWPVYYPSIISDTVRKINVIRSNSPLYRREQAIRAYESK